MESFSDYILEEDLTTKMEIAYYLSKKLGIYFDKSVVLKTEIARMFIDYMKLDIDRNLVLTACLLCNCKKVNDAQKIGKLRTYALDGALYLKENGFSSRFCRICEGVNRYSGISPREKESDILELVDCFGGLILDRPERIGFDAEEALVLIEHRILNDKNNRYLELFKEFVNKIEQIRVEDTRNMKPIKLLVKLHNDSKDVKEFINKVCYEYSNIVDEIILKRRESLKGKMFGTENSSSNRTLFTETTTQKIIGQLKQKPALN